MRSLPNSPPEVRERWLTDQPIVYIGKAGGPNFKSTLRKRVRQLYRHRYGDRAPHRGGQDVKLLRDRLLWLFWAPTQQDPLIVERQMRAAFVAQAGHWPFANRQD